MRVSLHALKPLAERRYARGIYLSCARVGTEKEVLWGLVRKRATGTVGMIPLLAAQHGSANRAVAAEELSRPHRHLVGKGSRGRLSGGSIHQFERPGGEYLFADQILLGGAYAQVVRDYVMRIVYHFLRADPARPDFTGQRPVDCLVATVDQRPEVLFR